MDHPGKSPPIRSLHTHQLTPAPVKDIPAVLRKSAHGTPQEQNDALKAYFLPSAALSAPFIRVPPVGDHSVRYLGIVNSRRAIYVLFRLRNLLVRTLEFSVESAGKLCIPRLSPIDTLISSSHSSSLHPTFSAPRV